MNFKECAIIDLDIIFNEFSEIHNIDSNKVPIIIDDERLKGKQAALGIAELSLLFMAKTKDLPIVREPGDYLDFDNRGYIVAEWSEIEGLTTVLLSVAS